MMAQKPLVEIDPNERIAIINFMSSEVINVTWRDIDHVDPFQPVFFRGNKQAVDPATAPPEHPYLIIDGQDYYRGYPFSITTIGKDKRTLRVIVYGEPENMTLEAGISHLLALST